MTQKSNSLGFRASWRIPNQPSLAGMRACNIKSLASLSHVYDEPSSALV